jgi:hypothetical protein
MPTQYPYKSDRLCLVCGEPIYINWPSHQGKKLCSEKCRIQFIKLKMKVEKKRKIVLVVISYSNQKEMLRITVV